MKRKIWIPAITLLMLAACGSGEKAETAAVTTGMTESIETETESIEAAETQAENTFTLKASPDKYTQYADNYVGLNAASVGYTSLGEDRLVEIGAGFLQITYITEDGTYVGPADEEDLKNYVVTGQNIEPNTEIRLEFSKDSDGKEYDNLVNFQSYEKLDLAVKKVGNDDPLIELTPALPSPDRYTYYIRNYVGKNLASAGYVSLGGYFLDAYGAGTLQLNIASEDGSYIDIADESLLQQYVVTGQNISPGSEMKYTYLKDSNGTEYENLLESQTYESITLNVRTVTGEPAVPSTTEQEAAETEAAETEPVEEKETTAETQTDQNDSDTGYEDIYTAYESVLKETTPILIEEYRAETEGISEIDRKAEICTAKVEDLAEICNEGVEEMAQYMMTHGDAEGYSEWSGKIYDVYMSESQKITDEYMNTLL